MGAEVDGFSNDDTTQVDEWVELWYNKYGYNGEAHTAEGLQYLRSRYYEPVTGSFISADSYRGEYSNPLSQNRYTYCHNNPYKYDDPTGHLPSGGLNKNEAMMLGGTTPTVVSKKKKEEETSSSGSSKPNTTPGPDVNPSSSQVYMYDQVSKPTYVQEYDLNASKKEEQTYAVPGMQEKLTENKNINFSDTPVALDTSANQKVPVKIIEDEEVIGKAESSNVGTETTIVTEPYYYSNPFGVEPIQYSSSYDYDFWAVYEQVKSMIPSSVSDALIQDYLADVLMDNVAENIDDIVSDVVGKIVASTAIAIPKYPKTEYVSVFDDIASQVIKGAKLYSDQMKAELAKSTNKYALYANGSQAATAYGLGVAVAAAYDIIINDEDISEAIGESIVKTGATMAISQGVVSAVVMMNIVASSALIAPVVVAAIGIGASYFVEYLDEEFELFDPITDSISDTIEGIGNIFGYDW